MFSTTIATKWAEQYNVDEPVPMPRMDVYLGLNECYLGVDVDLWRNANDGTVDLFAIIQVDHDRLGAEAIDIRLGEYAFVTYGAESVSGFVTGLWPYDGEICEAGPYDINNPYYCVMIRVEADKE